MNTETAKRPSNRAKYLLQTVVFIVFAAAVITLILALFPANPKGEDGKVLRMASTTSVEGSGLLDALLPAFKSKYGIEVRYVAVGTGQAMRVGIDGNADVLLLHDRDREEEFMADGYGQKRVEIMENFFLLIGPENYYAELTGMDACELLRSIAERGLPFVSRGDESGTHSKERALWREAGVEETGDWLIDAGSGMVETLRVASARNAFALTDSSTWMAHRDSLRLVPYVTEGEYLRNVYSLIIMNKELYPETDVEQAEKFLNFVLREEGREIIATLGKKEFGDPLFNLLEAAP